MYGAGDVRVARACRSDLHPYHSKPASADGNLMGHELVGVVEETGSEVTTLRKGDFVVAHGIVRPGGVIARARPPRRGDPAGPRSSLTTALCEEETMLTPTARANHDALFSHDASTLAHTDPDLLEIFDNFAFDDVLTHGVLDTHVRLLTQLAALIGAGAVAEFRVMAVAALTVGVSPVQVKEVLYQAVPYVGMGRAYDFVRATNDVLTERGVELPLPSQSTTTRDTRAAAGRALQEQIVGADRVAAMYANAPEDEQHLQLWLSAHCFGDHYTRTGLDVPTRELVTLALLVALGGADAQVRGHVAANRNVGNDRQMLIEVVTQLLPFVGYPRTLNALAAIDEIDPPPTAS
jgi:4-carboxymuconolactone decarboxylase